ncbi:MAG: hypothetical protein GAK37_03146 [Pseudomonas sp.]|nr:MAG: hypothetical protein GAK37_03146 [Pseudomonas sp.]
MTAIPNGLDPAENTGTDAARNKFETALFTAVDRPAFDPSKIRGPSIPLPYQNVQAPVGNTITYTPLGSDKPVTLKQIDNPRLFEQLVNQYNAQKSDDALAKNLADSKSAGYQEADASTVAPGLANYKAIGSTTELGPGLIRYETTSGDKVVVSQKETPALFAQVSGDSAKLFAINASQAEGYRLAGPDEPFDPAAAIGAPEEVGPGLIRYTAASGDKVIVSQDETPALYDQVVKLQAGASGLQVYTQDWRTERKITSDLRKLEQEYVVEVSGEIIKHGLERLNRGFEWKGQELPAVKASWQNETRLRMVLKNPAPGLIELLCRSVGLQVVGMRRIRLGGVAMGKLPAGQWRYLETKEKF